MWRPWPATKNVGMLNQRRPSNRNPPRFCNLSNLKVIETNGSNENSCKGAPSTNSPGHSISQHSGDLKHMPRNLVPIQPSKSSASFKVKQKYFKRNSRRRRNRRNRKYSKTDSDKLLENKEKEPAKWTSEPLQKPSENLPVATACAVSPSPSLALTKQALKDQNDADAVKATEKNDKLESIDMNEDLFEEVEVASFEAEGQEVPVSFRKTRVKYLKYKKKSFFKPKVYEIDKQSVTVSCMSSTKDISSGSLRNKTKTEISEDLEQECLDEGSDLTELAEEIDEADLMLVDDDDDDDEIAEESSDKEVEDVSKQEKTENNAGKDETRPDSESKPEKIIPDMITGQAESVKKSGQIDDTKEATVVSDGTQLTEVDDGKKANKFEDAIKPILVADEKSTTLNAAEKSTTLIADENNTTQIVDGNSTTQIVDGKNTTQIADGKNTAQIIDGKNSAQITDEKNTAQITDGKNTALITDGKDAAQITDSKNTAQITDEKNTTHIANEQNTARVVDERNATEIDHEKKTQVSSDQKSNQVDGGKKSIEVNDARKSTQVDGEKKTTKVNDSKRFTQVDAKKSTQVDGVKKGTKFIDSKKTSQAVDAQKITKVNAQKTVVAKSAPKKKPVGEKSNVKTGRSIVPMKTPKDRVQNLMADIKKKHISPGTKVSKANRSDKSIDISNVDAKQSPKGKVIEVIDLDDDDEEEEIEIVKSKFSSQIVPRVYKKFADQSISFYQGKSVIQMSLDSWKSHLVGLEYLIEVQDKEKDEILSHHCVLCNSSLPFGKFKSIVVLNHINSYEHIANYMEKFFPTYNFRENKGFDNIVTLQKVCEEINQTYGYYSICTSSLDKFVFCKEALLKRFLNLEKLYEVSGCPDVAFIQKTFERVFEDEIKTTIKSIFHKLSEKQNAIKEKRRLKSLLQTKKGTPVSSFLKLKLASVDFKKSVKSSNQKASVTVPPTAPTKSKEPAKESTDVTVDAKEAAGVQVDADDNSVEIEILAPEGISPKESTTPVVKASAKKESPEGKEKSVVKPSLHSKHCPKRNQYKENSRSTGKASLSNELAVDAASNFDSKQKRSVTISNASEIKSDSVNKNFRQRGYRTRRNKGFTSVHSVSVRQTIDSHETSSAYREVNIKSEKGQDLQMDSKKPKKLSGIKFEKGEDLHTVSEVSRKKSDREGSPFQERSASPYKRIVRRVSKSPPRRVITSPLRVSPPRRIRSPLRSSPNRRITSPLRVNPVRRQSRSPARRIRRPLSPVNKFSRRRSRSPIRRRSRSPLRRISRSPVRRSSRSPYKRRSRSPGRKHSRSPVRRRSKTPLKRSVRSPARGYARSPGRRQSRSPVRRNSRSPRRKFSRSPRRRRSRSYERKRSRSPINRRSRSPQRRISRSPLGRESSASEKYKNTFRAVTPPYEQRIKESSRDSFGKYSSSRSPQRNLGKHSSRYDSIKHKQPTDRTESPSSLSEKFIPFLNSLTNADTDLDPVSDEDESKYFTNVDEMQPSESKISSVQKKFVIDLLKKFSMADNPTDAAVNKFMEFMQAHSSELQEMMGSKSSTKSLDASLGLQQQTSFLQQCLFENLGIKRDQLPPADVSYAAHSSTAVPSFGQQSYLPSQLHPKYGQMIPGLDHAYQSLNQAKSFPPALSMPTTNQFSTIGQKLSNPVPAPKPRVPSEVMFKDLKAKVSKLFGPNVLKDPRMPEAAKPAFGTEQASSNFDHSHPDSSKFVSPGQKSLFNPMVSSANFSAQSIPGIRDDGLSQFNQPPFYGAQVSVEQARGQSVQVPPPNAKVSFCEAPSTSVRGNLFPVVNRSVNDAKVSLAQRLASVLVKVGMIDVPAPLLQEMLMKIGAFSSSPPQDITEGEIVSILKRLGYL